MITEIKSYPLWAYSFTILQLYLATPHQYRLFATIPPLMPTITSYNLTLKRFQLINSTVDQSPQMLSVWLIVGLSSLTWVGRSGLESGAGWGCTPVVHLAINANRINQPSPRTTLRAPTRQDETPALSAALCKSNCTFCHLGVVWLRSNIQYSNYLTFDKHQAPKEKKKNHGL